MHRAHLNEFYGEQTRKRKAPTRVVLFNEDEGENGVFGMQSGKQQHDDDIWEEDEEDQGEEGERRRATLEANEVEYPQPEFAIAIQTTRHATLRDLVDDYSAKRLEPALQSFLEPYARGRGQYFILPHDSFDVWHKLSLYHLPLSFAPDEAPHRDVIRVRPPDRDAHGRVRDPGVFDTALYLHDCREFGLHRKHLLLVSI
jgi:hypothetical protein